MGIDREWVVREVRSGRTMTDVARECGVTVGHISRICAAGGLRLRPRRQEWEPERQAREESIVEMRDVWGMSFGHIGRSLGITDNRVSQIYRKATEARDGS